MGSLYLLLAFRRSAIPTGRVTARVRVSRVMVSRVSLRVSRVRTRLVLGLELIDLRTSGSSG